MSFGQRPVISWFILGFIRVLFLLPCVDGAVRFTHVPPPILYVSSGGTAKFVWDYHVDDRDSEFDITSPEWYYTNSINKMRIASEALAYVSGKYEWIWSVSPSCPARLKHRLSKESVATLVISNVSTLDNGEYSCQLVLRAGGNNPSSTTRLIATVHPTFLPSHPNNAYQFIEGRDLKINCTAIGPPTPNITWVNITDGSVVIKSQGSGSDVLQIDNIKRYHAGVYECQAKNNPNEDAITTRTTVTVFNKPAFLKDLSSDNHSSWNGKKVTLKCTFDGFPTPSITWYKPSGEQTGVTSNANSSRLVITTTNAADYGLYKCKATNTAGSDEHVIYVTQLFPPGTPNVTILDQDIQASSVIVRWTKPGYDGGSPVIDYKAQINTNPAQEHNTTKTEHEFTGLTKDTRYEVRVNARNVVGYGNSFIITFTTKKKGPPPLPDLQLNKSKIMITLYWAKPDENGGTIKNYTIYQKQGVDQTWTRIHVVRDLSNLTYVIQLKDLEPGQTYWFIVTATNEFGESEIGSSDKGEKVYVLPKIATTTQTTTTAFDRDSMENSDKQDNCSVTALAVCAAFLAVSLILNILLLLYIWRNIKRKEPTGNTNTSRFTRNQAVKDPVYDNTIEMKENPASRNPVPDTRQRSSPATDYEPIGIAHDRHPIEVPDRTDGYSSNSTATPSHYQALSNPGAAGSSHKVQGPTYEPLHRPQVKESAAQQPKRLPDTTYQSLSVRLNPTDYQDLQTYNENQLGNSRNAQSFI